MSQTTITERTELAQELAPLVKDLLSKQSKQVTDVEEVTSTEYVTTLPALYVAGGIKKTVRVALSTIVSESATKADNLVVAATNAANTAASKAQDVVDAASKQTLNDALDNYIRPTLEQEMELEIKANWQIFPIALNRYDRHGRALDYVGYQFYREQKLMRKSIKQNFCRKASEINDRTMAERDYRQAVAPWMGWAEHSDSQHLTKTILIYNNPLKFKTK